MILHIGSSEKFINSFIELEQTHFEYKTESHFFLKYNKNCSVKLPYENIRYYSRNVFQRIKLYLDIIYNSNRYSKIILHGYFDKWIALLLITIPKIGKKSFWVLWGGDLYSLINRNCSFIDYYLRSRGIKRIEYILTYIKGDYELAKSKFGFKGKLIDCLMYDSNVYHTSNNQPWQINYCNNNSLKILVGNSGDPGNLHLKIFKILKHFEIDVKVYCPLSYGNKNYINNIKSIGEKYFGTNFIPLTDFMPREKYDQFLSSIDVAIFAHERQQAMGNIINLLGLGKRVFLNDQTTSWEMLRSKNIVLYSLEDLNFDNMTKKEPIFSNTELIESLFNKQQLIRNWKHIYEL